VTLRYVYQGDGSRDVAESAGGDRARARID
jgi:hypothetical protein